MSDDKYFIFKTASPTPTYIGYDPGENAVAHGIKFTTTPDGNILYNGLDENDCRLLIIENPKANIKTIKDFDNNYKPFTTGVKLIMTSNSFSKCVKDAIDASQSGKTSSGKTSSVKPTKAKKASKKGGASKKKRSSKKKSSRKGGCGERKGGRKGSKKKSSRKGGCGCSMMGGKKKSSKKKSKKK